jgi:hypothetical protein
MGNILFHLQFPPIPDPPAILLESFFESLDGWEQSKGGTANIVLDVDKVTMTTGLTAGSFAVVWQRFLYPPKPFDWGKPRSFRVKARIDHFNDAASEIQIFTGDYGTNLRGFGFRFTNDKIRGYSQNGAAKQYVDLVTGKTPPWAATHLLEAIFTPATKVDFYLDSVFMGTLATGLPTGATNAEKLIGFFLLNGAAVSHTMYFSMVRALQEI